MNPSTSRLTIPAHIRYLRPSLAYVAALAESAGFDSSECGEIEIAMEEALHFIIRKLYPENSSETFDLTCEPAPHGMDFVIHEKGMPMSPEMLPAYSPARPMDERGLEELGIFLISRLMDSITFVNLGKGGMEWRLSKNCRSRRIDMLAGIPGQGETAPRPPPPEAEVFSYHLQELTPELALEVSKCAYLSYGYTYDEIIYYPERIMALNEEGLLSSVVAVTDSGELIGHAALRLATKTDPVGELVMGVVSPRFRNRGVFGILTRDRTARAEELGLRGLYIHSVTSHPASQKASHDHGGFEATGVLLGLLPSDTEFRAMTGRVAQKESAVLMFRAIGSQPEKRLYLPARHREMISAIYAKHSIPFHEGDIAGGSEIPLQPGTGETMVCSFNPVSNTAMIEVLCYDASSLADLRSKFHYYRLERTDAIFCCLDLEAPAAPAFSDACEKMGFYFAGVLPGGLRGRDMLVLQYLNNLRIDYDLLSLYTPFTREILSYIRRMAPSGA